MHDKFEVDILAPQLVLAGVSRDFAVFLKLLDVKLTMLQSKLLESWSPECPM